MRQSPQAATQQKRKRPEAPGEAANTAGSISAVKTSKAAGFERVRWMGLPWSSAAFAPHGKNKSTACVQLRQELQAVAFSSPHPQNAPLRLLSRLD